jgi:hypothetical protein
MSNADFNTEGAEFAEGGRRRKARRGDEAEEPAGGVVGDEETMGKGTMKLAER